MAGGESPPLWHSGSDSTRRGPGGVQRRPPPAASGLRSHRRRLFSAPALPRLVVRRLRAPHLPARRAASLRCEPELPVLNAILARSRPLSSSAQANMASAEPRKGTRQGRDGPGPPPPPPPRRRVTHRHPARHHGACRRPRRAGGACPLPPRCAAPQPRPAPRQRLLGWEAAHLNAGVPPPGSGGSPFPRGLLCRPAFTLP